MPSSGAGATVEVRVELKPGVLDAEAESIEKSLGLLGIGHLAAVRTARVYTLVFEGVNQRAAEKLAAEAVDRLLANPVIHQVRVQPAAK